MVENGQEWLGMAGDDREWPENDRDRPEMIKNGRERPEMARNRREMIGNGWKWLGMDLNGSNSRFRVSVFK